MTSSLSILEKDIEQVEPATAVGYAVKARALTKSFGSVHAVRGIDFSLARGEVVALLGPNGAGKSTTIEMLMGLVQPDSGELSVLDQAPGRAASHGRVAAMLQTGALLEDQKVGQMLSLIAGLHGASDRLPELVEQLDAKELLNRRVRKCSGGQRQKIRLIMALLPDPEFLILDEPTAGLDPVARRQFWQNMRDQAAQGRAILFATHYLDEAEEFAQRTIIMNQGKIVADGPTAEVRAQAASQHLRAIVPDNQWPGLQTELDQLRLSEADFTYRDRLFEIRANDLRTLAIKLLENDAISGVELINASLEDTFATLIESK